MTACIAPLNPISLDSVWPHDFIFEGDDLSGGPVGLVLVSVGRPLVSRRFDLGEGLALASAERLVVRLTPSLMEGLRPGDYAYQIQKGEGDEVETLLKGEVPIGKGLTPYLDTASAPLQTAATAGSMSPVLTVPPSSTRVVRGGGLIGDDGPPGPNSADLIGFDDLLTGFGVDTIQEVLVLIAGSAGFGPGGLNFNNPNNTGLGLVLGVL